MLQREEECAALRVQLEEVLGHSAQLTPRPDWSRSCLPLEGQLQGQLQSSVPASSADRVTALASALAAAQVQIAEHQAGPMTKEVRAVAAVKKYVG